MARIFLHLFGLVPLAGGLWAAFTLGHWWWMAFGVTVIWFITWLAQIRDANGQRWFIASMALPIGVLGCAIYWNGWWWGAFVLSALAWMIAQPPFTKPAGEAASQTAKPGQSSEPRINEKLELNSAEFHELITLPGIGAAEAKLIQAQIEAGKYFQSAQELVDKLEISPHFLSQLQDRLSFVSPQVAIVPPLSPPNAGRVID